MSIKQLDKNKVRIYLTGKNVKNTELVFVNEVFETTPKISKKININRPINEYKATNYEDDLDETQEMQSWDDNSFNFSHLGITMIQTILTSPIAKGITGFICLLILFLVIKSITSNISKDQEPLIGLNGAKLNEHDNFDEQSDQYALGTNCFDINEINNQNTRNKTLELAQNELKKAHEKYQQYVKDKYGALKQPKKVDFDAIKQSIALNQYQKTSQNPYQNQPVVNMDKVNNLTKGYTSDIKTKFDRSDDFSLGENKASFVPKNPVMPKKEFTSPYIKRKTNLVKDDSFNVQKPNMKFLDSVTKIYERSGREDLANGLKNSISKAKQII